MKRVAIYARVSTDEQAERQTVDAQLYECREKAGREGWEVAEEFVDDGVSGAVPFEERPAGARLFEAAEGGELDAVLATVVDRLARDVADAVLVRKGLERRGVSLEFVHQSFDGTPEGKFQYNIFASVAEYEREVIARRTKAGRARRARDGAYMCPRVPYGYVRKDGRLEPRPDQAKVVRQAFEWSRGGMSLAAIADRLDGDGMPTPSGNGAGWGSATVLKLLTHPRYIGRSEYGRRAKANVEQARRSRERGLPPPSDDELAFRVLEMRCPPLVSEELFEEVQKGLASRRRDSRGRTRRDREYMLAKRVVCPHCGSRCDAQAQPRRRGPDHVVYLCRERRTKRRRPGVAERHEGRRWYWRAGELEVPVRRFVRELLRHPERTVRQLDELRRRQTGPERSRHEAKEARLRGRLEKLGQQEARVLDGWERGVYRGEGQFRERLEAVRREQEAAQAELDAHLARPAPDDERGRVAEELLGALTQVNLGGAWELTHPEMADTVVELEGGQRVSWQELVRAFVEEVRPLDDGTVEVRGIISTRVLPFHPSP